MSLRREIRRTKTSGKTYARVESVIMHKATVTLIGSSNKLTNLPIYGSNVNVGDTVIVEYPTSGQPYIRAITINPKQNSLPEGDVDISFPEITENYSPAYSDEEIVQESDDMVIVQATTAGHKEMITTYNAGADSWKAEVVVFDTAVYDQKGLLNPTNGHIGILEPGPYLVDLTLGVSYDVQVADVIEKIQVFLLREDGSGTYSSSGFLGSISQGIQNVEGKTDIHVIHSTFPIRISKAGMSISAAITMVLAERDAPWTLLKSGRKYPQITVWKMADHAVGPRASRYWWDTGQVYG